MWPERGRSRPIGVTRPILYEEAGFAASLDVAHDRTIPRAPSCHVFVLISVHTHPALSYLQALIPTVLDALIR